MFHVKQLKKEVFNMTKATRNMMIDEMIYHTNLAIERLIQKRSEICYDLYVVEEKKISGMCELISSISGKLYYWNTHEGVHTYDS